MMSLGSTADISDVALSVIEEWESSVRLYRKGLSPTDAEGKPHGKASLISGEHHGKAPPIFFIHQVVQLGLH